MGTSLGVVPLLSRPLLGWSGFNMSVLLSSISGTLEGTTGLSLLGEGVLEATTSLYERTARGSGSRGYPHDVRGVLSQGVDDSFHLRWQFVIRLSGRESDSGSSTNS